MYARIIRIRPGFGVCDPPGTARIETEIQRRGSLMIVFGIGLMIVAALVPKLVVLWGVGGLVLALGVILAVLGMMGRAAGGRRHYY
jgi:hypothetical protein